MFDSSEIVGRIRVKEKSMVDTRLQDAQKWLNSTFGTKAGWTKVAEDGYPGQGTVNGLIEGMQSLLGISPVVPAFGATTWSKLNAHGAITPADGTTWIKLVQAALYAKGYRADGNSGKWTSAEGAETPMSIAQLKADIGVGGDGMSVPPKVMRSLLNTDPAVLISTGDARIRTVQQWLNKTYGSHEAFYYNSTSGYFDRGTQQNLVRGIQYQLGQGESAADGLFGPGSASQLKAAAGSVVRVGSTDSSTNWVHLFLAALAFNGYFPAQFDGTFTAADSAIVKQFQQFQGFSSAEQTGIGDFRTWAELLVSTGDASRSGTAVDCASTVTAARAQSLKAAGYRIVGRYLTNMEPTVSVQHPIDKNIKPGELQTIFGAGLSVFPIFEEGDGYSWFTYNQGVADATRAVKAAKSYGFPAGTTIYFAVDFDATDEQISPSADNAGTVGITAYFRGVQVGIRNLGSTYAVGIYGTRNVCARVSARGWATKSFIAGLSTGWSGNLGFRLPSNWAFNQIQGLTVGSGDGAIDIDKNIASGRDVGVSSLTTPPEPNTAVFQYLDWLLAKAHDYNQVHSAGDSDADLLCQYMRLPDFTGKIWDTYVGPINQGFVDYVNSFGVTKQTQIVDPEYRFSIDTPHLFGGADAIIHRNIPVSGSLSTPDWAGWAGDLLQLMRQYPDSRSQYPSAYKWAAAFIGSSDPQQRGNVFGLTDLVQDAALANIGGSILSGSTQTIAQLVRREFAINGDYAIRFADFVSGRFGGSYQAMWDAAYEVLASTNPAVVLIRTGFSKEYDVPDFSGVKAEELRDIAKAFADKVWDLANIT
jgi:peptidoglycan hydrolase-like protein with peptidoglycan-binding domain